MTSELRRRAGDVATFAFAGADLLAGLDGEEHDQALTVCLQAIEAGLQATTYLTPAECSVLALDLLLEAIGA